MFFVRNLLKSPTFVLLTRRFNHPPQCPQMESGKKHQYSKPDCAKIIIIGGTGTVGLATANQLFCSKASKIALIDTDICKGKETVTSLNCSFGKERAVFFKASVTNKMDIQNALRKARGELKQVDLIVNAFGVWNESKWEEEINVNLVGTVNVNEIAKEVLVQGGCVVNIVGLPGIEVFSPSPVLAASYLGVVAYTQARGHERMAAITGVRTVALCCGITHSDMVKEVEKKVCCAQMGNDLKKFMQETCWQKADVVGKAVVEVLKFAPTGSVWIVEGSRLFLLNLPDLKETFRTLENQFI